MTRKKRMGRNEALFREINDYIADVSQTIPTSETFEILCECARLNCVEKIGITNESYVAARGGDDTFIVLRGHHLPEVERIVAEEDGFLLVEKVGEARAGAEEAAQNASRSLGG